MGFKHFRPGTSVTWCIGLCFLKSLSFKFPDKDTIPPTNMGVQNNKNPLLCVLEHRLDVGTMHGDAIHFHHV